MLVREAAQNNTFFLLSSWLGIVLFCKCKNKPRLRGSPPMGPWRSQGRGFPSCFHLCLWSHIIYNQTMLPLGMSPSEAQKVSSSPCPSLTSTGLSRAAPGAAQRLPALANAPLKSSPLVATLLRPAALPSPKYPVTACGLATSSWRTLTCLFTHLHFARGRQTSLCPGFGTQLRQAEETATQGIWGCLSCTPHGS